MTFDDETLEKTRATWPRESEDHATVLLIHRRAEGAPHDLRLDVRRRLAARYQLLETADAMVGIRLALRHQPDLVVCDAGVPSLEGYVPCRGLEAETPVLPPEDRTFLGRLEALITENLADDDFDTAVLTRRLATSRTKLYQRLRLLLGCSPAELIMERRLERAAELFAEGIDSVSEVAFGVGFKSVSHFSRRFKQRYGIRPSAVIGQVASKFILGGAGCNGKASRRDRDAQAKVRDVRANGLKAGSLL